MVLRHEDEQLVFFETLPPSETGRSMFELDAIKQVQPGLSPALVKSILQASARDVTNGASAMGQPAGEGFDGATGTGLVDAYAALTLARSVTTRDLFTLPPPR